MECRRPRKDSAPISARASRENRAQCLRLGVMTASDHLSPGQFYHGTNQKLEPGTRLVPGGSGDRWRDTDSHVYFTSNPDAAMHYAEHKYRDFGGSGLHVYAVEPDGPVTKDSHETWLLRPGNMKISARAKKAPAATVVRAIPLRELPDGPPGRYL